MTRLDRDLAIWSAVWLILAAPFVLGVLAKVTWLWFLLGWGVFRGS
jgi:hypothetical protein